MKEQDMQNCCGNFCNKEKIREDLADFAALASLLGAAWYYGDWVAETPGEREMEQIMTRLGYWSPDIDEDVVVNHCVEACKRATDRMVKSKE